MADQLDTTMGLDWTGLKWTGLDWTTKQSDTHSFSCYVGVKREREEREGERERESERVKLSEELAK